KARAKLEELNRRTQIVEDSGKSLEADYGTTEDPGSLSTAVLPSRSNLVSGHVVQQSREAKTTIGGEICEGSTGETRTCAVPEVTISIEVSSAASSMTTESTYTKRKNNRNGKKKHKVEETTTENTSGHVTKETESGGKSIETGKDKAAETELPSDSIPSHMDSKELGDSAEKITSSVKEEAQGRAKSHWKSQHSRRPQRGSQGNKPAEKFQGTDAVIWAPVRTQPKADIPDEASYKAAAESVASASIGHQAQINSKSKRVELERY
ncbi:PREDICTED: protein MODIFIER OF SNC1 1-like, partial [Tarenaya hassleriana]|uniref:protein MODIFIER OF SNC1 1-like n=1 Tax=Tarenaya hassleriana TaxID=28532 RepID=UPI00053C850F